MEFRVRELVSPAHLDFHQTRPHAAWEGLHTLAFDILEDPWHVQFEDLQKRELYFLWNTFSGILAACASGSGAPLPSRALQIGLSLFSVTFKALKLRIKKGVILMGRPVPSRITSPQSMQRTLKRLPWSSKRFFVPAVVCSSSMFCKEGFSLKIFFWRFFLYG